MQTLDAQVASQSKDGYEDMHQRLKQILGTVAEATPELDRKGLDSLKNLQQGIG